MPITTPINNRLAIKTELLSLIESLPRNLWNLPDSPITDLKLPPATVAKIESLTQSLEAVNPNLQPLLYALPLLDGSWRLLYSTAREIRALEKLPLGLKVGQIFQNIDLATASFENKAFVKHSLGLLQGYVKVTATFEANLDQYNRLPDRRINVNFQERFLAIQRVLGWLTPMLDPFKVVAARNPVGRTPTLDITYLDDTVRIGRGGEGSLFILIRAC